VNTNLISCPAFIGGEWIEAKNSGTPVHNPSTGEVIAECPMGSAADVNAAVEAAQFFTQQKVTMSR